jgi:glutamate carboxypeptidase
MTPSDLLSWCAAEERWLRDTIEALVRLESPSTNPDALARCAAELARRIQAIGGMVERLPGGHVRAAVQGDGRRPVMLLGHFDTVWEIGTLARMPLVERDGRLHGPGVFDMKSGIGVALLALRAVRAAGISHPPVTLLWTADEETGSATSRAVIEAEAARSAAVLVLEPSLPGGAAKTRRKGCGEFEVVIHGVAAHAGIDPTKGVSAIHELACQIGVITALQDLSRGVTVNVGVVSGGTRPNVVAEEARATVDVRVPTMADAAHIEQRMASLTPALPGARVEVRGGVSRPPLERTPAVLGLYQAAREVARELGRDLGEGATGGGSDGNFTAALGVPTLDGLGPEGDGAHAAHEHVVLADLPWRAALIAGLILRVGLRFA